MINHEERLRGKRNCALFAGAKHYRGGYIRAACIAGHGLKAAVVVSKKVAPKAVDRNKLKRRLRELYRKCRHILPPNIWLMILALPDAAEADYTSLEADLNALFTQIASKNAGNKRS